MEYFSLWPNKLKQKLAEIIIDAIRESTGAIYTFGTIADLLCAF
jgi:hypothetical protein